MFQLLCMNITKRISVLFVEKMFSLPSADPVNFILVTIILYSYQLTNSDLVLWYL